MNPDSPMNPDKYQQAWQAQSSQTSVTIDTDLLRKEVQRNQRSFRSSIFWRDFREIAVGIVMLPVWFYLGSALSLPWTWYLAVPAGLWLIGFFLVDRRLHKQRPTEPGEPLLESVRKSLAEMEHQIWLLRNVFWWYLLPFTIPIQAFFAHTALLMSDNWLAALGSATPYFLFLVVLYYFIDYLNQRAVRVDLVPRRQELLALLASLGDESTESAAMTSVESVPSTGPLRRWIIVAVLSFVTLVAIGLASDYFGAGAERPAVPIDDAALF